MSTDTPTAKLSQARTIEAAKKLSAKVNRDNVYIKIPATVEGLEARRRFRTSLRGPWREIGAGFEGPD